MQIERVVFPIHTLGPGKRIVIWTNGCSKRCPGCMSPELLPQRPDKDMPLPQLLSVLHELIKNNHVDGITISGGEPIEQAQELVNLISNISVHCPDILIYSGKTLDEIEKALPNNYYDALIKHTAVLIDGEYIEALNDCKSTLTGSTNQVIHFFRDDIKEKYENYIHNNHRTIQNIYYGSKLISIGLHNARSNGSGIK